jgi:hypothetical protein
MAERRRLTEAEKADVEAKALASERAAHPGAHIAVDVDDYTADDGEPVIKILRIDGLEPRRHRDRHPPEAGRFNPRPSSAPR